LKEAETSEKRAQLRAALASGKPLDPTIANDKALRKDFQWDESAADDAAIDDEYAATSGLSDPRIIGAQYADSQLERRLTDSLVTTSRDPSSRLSAFAKEIRLLFPTSVRLNRGNLILPDLVKSSQANGLTDIILLSERMFSPLSAPNQAALQLNSDHAIDRGTPTALTLAHQPHGPVISFSLHNVTLRHDLPSQSFTTSESYPHLICKQLSFYSVVGSR